MFTTAERQPVDSQVEVVASKEYLINTDQIIEMTDESDLPTVTTKILYKFNFQENRTTPFEFDVNETQAAIVTLADATKASEIIAINVFEDGSGNSIQSFNQVGSLTAVTRYFNVDDIVWGEDDPTGNYARIWVKRGGHSTKPLIVDHNIDQIIDTADTATTTAS